MTVDPHKDREIILAVEYGRAEIVYRRSSSHPVTYAVVLRVRDGNRWRAVVSVDNSHEGRPNVDVNHLHRYVDDAKQPAESLPFAVEDAQDAMAKAIKWMADNWAEISS